MSMAKTARRRSRHVTAAVVFVLLSTAILVTLVSREGIQGLALWVIAGHQLVAQVIVIGWIWLLCNDDDEKSL